MLLRLRFFASNLTKPRGFPYEFGRTKTNEPASNLHYTFMSEAFGHDVLKGFENAYRNIIEALQDKDKGYLQGIFEPNLINNLTFPNTKLINSNSTIDVRLIRNQLIFGTSFYRQQYSSYKNTSKQSIASELFKYSIYMPKSLTPDLLKSTPIFRTVVEVSTAYKLVREGDTENTKTQNHLLQFQTLSKQENLNMMELMSYMQAGLQNKIKASSTEFIQKLVGKDFNWMVSDFDEYLNGNQWD